MGIIIKQGIGNTIISYAGIVLGFINTVFLFPLFLQPNEIGIKNTLINLALLVAAFAQFGLPQSIIRFSPHFEEHEKNAFNTRLLILAFSSSAFFTVLLFIFRVPIGSLFEQQSPKLIEFIELAYPLIILIVLKSAMEGISKANLNTTRPALLNDVVIRLFNTCAIILFGIDIITFRLLLIIIIAGYLFVVTFYLTVFLKNKVIGDFKHYNNSVSGSILDYALFLFIGSTGSVIIYNIDGVMIASMLGTSENGIYTTVLYMAVVIEVPRRAVVSIINPVLAREFKSQNVLAIKDIYQKSAINSGIIGGAIFLLITANIEEIFNIMPNGEKFEAGSNVILIIGIAKMLDMAFGTNGEIIMNSGYYRLNLVILFMMGIVTIVTNLLLIPPYGITGAALASLISILTYNIAKFYLVKSKLGLSPFSFRTPLLILIIALFYFGSRILPTLELSFISLLYKTLLIGVTYCVVIYFSRISSLINENIDKILRFKIK